MRRREADVALERATVTPVESDEVIVARVEADDVPIVCGYQTLREAARDWRAYSSNTPFRVPIPDESDLRDVQQFPIESDPPEHQAYRKLIEGRFSRTAAGRLASTVADLARSSLSPWPAGGLRVVDDLALPIVARSIAETLGRPEDASRIESWGVHVFVNPRTGQRERNRDVDAYLNERVDHARANGADDLFGDLAEAEVFDRLLTRDEMLGIGSLVLAGGRDTVINAIVGALWFLATHEAERQQLRADPSLIPAAVEEFLRYFSPLPFIGRTAVAEGELHGCPIASGARIGLGFAAANHDPRAFDGPERIAMQRRPNRHVAFGHGPHTCVGAPLARTELAVTIEHFVAAAPEHVEASRPWTPRPDSASLSTGWIPQDLRLAAGG